MKTFERSQNVPTLKVGSILNLRREGGIMYRSSKRSRGPAGGRASFVPQTQSRTAARSTSSRTSSLRKLQKEHAKRDKRHIMLWSVGVALNSNHSSTSWASTAVTWASANATDQPANSVNLFASKVGTSLFTRDNHVALQKKCKVKGFIHRPADMDRVEALNTNFFGQDFKVRIVLVKRTDDTDLGSLFPVAPLLKMNVLQYKDERYMDKFTVLGDVTLDFNNETGLIDRDDPFGYGTPSQVRDFSFNVNVNDLVEYGSNAEIPINGQGLYLLVNANRTFGAGVNEVAAEIYAEAKVIFEP